MNYKIENQIIIENPIYGALGDDFSIEDKDALDIIINKIEKVFSGCSEMESIYGKMCYQIDIKKEKCSIFCFDEFLGSEESEDIYNMLKEYRDMIVSKNNSNC